jgi:hypothetical protein
MGLFGMIHMVGGMLMADGEFKWTDKFFNQGNPERLSVT